MTKMCMYVLIPGKAEYPNPISSTKGRSMRETPLPIRIDMKDVMQSVGSFLSAPFKHALNMVVRMYVCMYVFMHVFICMYMYVCGIHTYCTYW